MRTTLNIDEDVLFAARELAERERSSVGAVLSDLARKQIIAANSQTASHRSKLGLTVLPQRPGARIITTELVNRLREESDV